MTVRLQKRNDTQARFQNQDRECCLDGNLLQRIDDWVQDDGRLPKRRRKLAAALAVLCGDNTNGKDKMERSHSLDLHGIGVEGARQELLQQAALENL
jgi:hypothetical protein